MMASAVASRTRPEHAAVDALKSLRPTRSNWLGVRVFWGSQPDQGSRERVRHHYQLTQVPLLTNLQMRIVGMSSFLQERRQDLDDAFVWAGIKCALADKAADVLAAVFGS